MTEFYGGRVRRPSKPSSFCAKCGNLVEDVPVPPGRGTWAEKGRGLSLEIDGREGREVRRRHSSAGLSNGIQGRSPMHCYIVPIHNGTEGATPLTSTYRESFRSPTPSQWVSRQVRSTPSSPIATSSPWLSTSPSFPFSTNRQHATPKDVHTLLSRLPSRQQSRDSSLDRKSTTYRDHFTWVS